MGRVQVTEEKNGTISETYWNKEVKTLLPNVLTEVED